jgi:DNA replication protein DnaC
MARRDCPICEGSGWKLVARTAAGAEAGVSASPALRGSAGASPTVWALPCDCTSPDRTERTLVRARLPERYRHCDFENFDTDHAAEQVFALSLAHAKLIVRRFAEEFAPEAEHGLLLMGPCGVGKTHLAASALKDIVQRGHTGLFYDYRELLKEIQDSYNAVSQSTEMSVLEPVLSTELLVLDDVGSSKPSAWALETVGHVLNTRYNNKRATILTTNFLDVDVAAAGGGAAPLRVAGSRAVVMEESLTERVGQRIRSRLYEMCRTVEITAHDYRKIARDAGFRS